MSKEKMSMRKLHEVFRLRFEQGLSYEKIATSVCAGETTVRMYLKRAERAGITWPLPPEIDEEALEKKLYPPRSPRKKTQDMLDFSSIHKELKKKGVTLQLLWEKFIGTFPEGYSHSRFCYLYKQWACKLNVWMPQKHKAGEKVFVDYAGLTIPIYNEKTRTFINAQIFVATLGASNYTYIEATESQKLEDWISSHQRMFVFFGGVPEIVVPDNLKSGVTSPQRYEPDCNPTYLKMVQHYGAAVIPARVKRPKDKAKVEKAVQDIERQILAKVMEMQFFSIQELNAVLWMHLEGFNNRDFQKVPGSRKSLFEELDKPALKHLPTSLYEFAFWERKTVDQSYHITIDGQHYSVPYKYTKQVVDIRFNDRTVEVFYKGNSIAVHQKSSVPGSYSTNNHHRPISHQQYAETNPETLLQTAKGFGIYAVEWVKMVLSDNTLHMRQREARCLGVLRLSKIYGRDRLNAACRRALRYSIFKLTNMKSSLHNLDQLPLSEDSKTIPIPQQHENIRGAEYYDFNQGEKTC
jgi:transposase